MKIPVSYILLIFQITVAQNATVTSSQIASEDLILFESVSNDIINLNFENADLSIVKIKNETLNTSLRQLSNILYYQGQECLPITYDTSLRHENSTLRSINYLIKAYDELFHKPNEGTSFSFFFEAYLSSKKTNNLILRKLTLMGLLEFYHYEFSQTNMQYETYLQEFESIAVSPIEKSWYHIYEIYFKSQRIFENERSAINAITKLEEHVEKLPINHKIRPLYLSLKAVQLEFTNNYKEAEQYHFMAIEESHNYPFLKYIKFRTYIRLAHLHYSKGSQFTEKASQYIDTSDSLKSHIYIQKYKSLNYYGLNEYKKAYDLLLQSEKLKDSLEYQENTSKNSKLEIQLQTLEKEKKIVQLLNTNLKSEAKRIKNRNWLIGSSSALILGLLITILLYKNTKRKQHIAEQEREIEIQKTEKLLKEQELTAIDAMISGQEKERQRLANDLHDNLGSTLATVKLHFDHLKNNRNNPKVGNIEELYSKTNNLLDEAYEKVRTIAHEKNSGVMAKQGLLPAIKNLTKKASNGNALQIEVQDYGLNERLDNTLEISIFRMIQELITNIIKHANASEINISLTNHDSLLNIIVEDNGKGFDAKILPEKDGMGLKSIEKRIEYLEGTFEIDSTLGKGTNIIINIPI
ncbi:sensor histidine kinase [uncultured Aquimarina sp.]|uniref:sensor histidine kinase n=1 Tax=uncultured Aquimarina sp. TaxID=575652 RepID=UPI00260DE08A|nr:sensor histidine kinase [uncultured Aquimarina sp.]